MIQRIFPMTKQFYVCIQSIQFKTNCFLQQNVGVVPIQITYTITSLGNPCVIKWAQQIILLSSFRAKFGNKQTDDDILWV